VFIGCLRLDLARTSWWARNSPRHWFRPRPGQVYTTARSCLEALDTPRDILEQRGARFLNLDEVRLYTNTFVVPDDDRPRWNKPFVRCAWPAAPHHDPSIVPRTYAVGVYPRDSKVPPHALRNGDQIFSIDGLMPTMTRQSPDPLGMVPIPGSAPLAKRFRPTVIRSYTCDEVQRAFELTGAWISAYVFPAALSLTPRGTSAWASAWPPPWLKL
jgi:hypothetical protein